MVMVQTARSLILVTILTISLFDQTMSQSNCLTSLLALMPCYGYVTGNPSTPSSSCCSQLSNVVTSQPQCLCLLLNNTASSYGFNINPAVALKLPSACNLVTPPASRCNGAGGSSRSLSPSALSPAPEAYSPAPNVGPIPSGSHIGASESGGNGIGSSIGAAVLLLFVANYCFYFS